MKIVTIIQARMGSTRLPGKVLEDLAGEPMLGRVVRRAQRATLVHETVVATTDLRRDDLIETFCRERGWPIFRGSQDDVLDRYRECAAAYGADAVVRITSDCPFIDPTVIDLVIGRFLDAQPGIHYASNVFPTRTYPRGLDVEVIRRDALETAWTDDSDPALREHVTPFIHRNPDRFAVLSVLHPADYSDCRWTVDTPEDLAFARRVYDSLSGDEFGWCEVLALLGTHPEWADINRHILQKVI